MAKPHSDLTEAELEVLKTLWELGPSSIRDLTKVVYPAGGAAHYATVQKLLERLEAKGCVRCRRDERVNIYAASVDRAAVIDHRLRDTARALCGGSMTPLLTHLVGTADLSPEELSKLRAIVDGRSKKKGKR
jgi:predicted transcriptional regulator